MFSLSGAHPGLHGTAWGTLGCFTGLSGKETGPVTAALLSVFSPACSPFSRVCVRQLVGSPGMPSAAAPAAAQTISPRLWCFSCTLSAWLCLFRITPVRPGRDKNKSPFPELLPASPFLCASFTVHVSTFLPSSCPALLSLRLLCLLPPVDPRHVLPSLPIRPRVSVSVPISAHFHYADEGRPEERHTLGRRGCTLLLCTTLFGTLAALHTFHPP